MLFIMLPNQDLRGRLTWYAFKNKYNSSNIKYSDLLSLYENYPYNPYVVNLAPYFSGILFSCCSSD